MDIACKALLFPEALGPINKDPFKILLTTFVFSRISYFVAEKSNTVSSLNPNFESVSGQPSKRAKFPSPDG